MLTYLLTLRCSLFSLFKLAQTPPNLPAHISTPLHMLQKSFSPLSHTMLHLHSHHSILLWSPQSNPPTLRPLIPLTRSTLNLETETETETETAISLPHPPLPPLQHWNGTETWLKWSINSRSKREEGGYLASVVFSQPKMVWNFWITPAMHTIEANTMQ
jgi:hypothetical protein